MRGVGVQVFFGSVPGVDDVRERLGVGGAGVVDWRGGEVGNVWEGFEGVRFGEERIDLGRWYGRIYGEED